MKHTQIDKVTGEPYLENHYNLYQDGRLIKKDVPFDFLVAAPEMLEALKTIRDFIQAGPIDAQGVFVSAICLNAIAKATGGAQ